MILVPVKDRKSKKEWPRGIPRRQQTAQAGGLPGARPSPEMALAAP